MNRRKKRPRRRQTIRRSARRNQDVNLPTILFNPVYGYGRWLEPTDVVARQVFRQNVKLAAKQKTLGRTLTLDELDEEFTALLDDLVNRGLCQRMQDLPPLMPKAEWLRAQQEVIHRLVAGEEL